MKARVGDPNDIFRGNLWRFGGLRFVPVNDVFLSKICVILWAGDVVFGVVDYDEWGFGTRECVSALDE